MRRDGSCGHRTRSGTKPCENLHGRKPGGEKGDPGDRERKFIQGGKGCGVLNILREKNVPRKDLFVEIRIYKE